MHNDNKTITTIEAEREKGKLGLLATGSFYLVHCFDVGDTSGMVLALVSYRTGVHVFVREMVG